MKKEQAPAQGFFAKKRLGQNFLVDARIIDRIIDACELSCEEDILEIGPGQGALTRAALPKVRHVHAVEADARFAGRLQEEFAQQNLTVYRDDILKFDLDRLPPGIKVIGNIPYNISTPIITRIIENRRRFTTFFITAQHEFGVRLVASPGSRDYSSLSCFVQMFARPRMLFKISPGAFRPMPKVTSCFMRVDLRKEPAEKVADEGLFTRIVRQAFQQRRKTLLNSLASLGAKNELAVMLAEAGIDGKMRAEDLSVADYARITNVYHRTTDLLSRH